MALRCLARECHNHCGLPLTTLSRPQVRRTKCLILTTGATRKAQPSPERDPARQALPLYHSRRRQPLTWQFRLAVPPAPRTPRLLEPRPVSRQLCRGVSSLYCAYIRQSRNRCSGKVTPFRRERRAAFDGGLNNVSEYQQGQRAITSAAAVARRIRGRL
jgi:hypothetical protein